MVINAEKGVKVKCYHSNSWTFCIWILINHVNFCSVLTALGKRNSVACSSTHLAPYLHVNAKLPPFKKWPTSCIDASESLDKSQISWASADWIYCRTSVLKCRFCTFVWPLPIHNDASKIFWKISNVFKNL